MNLYRYGNNNPVVNTDSTGLEFQTGIGSSYGGGGLEGDYSGLLPPGFGDNFGLPGPEESPVAAAPVEGGPAPAEFPAEPVVGPYTPEGEGSENNIFTNPIDYLNAVTNAPAPAPVVTSPSAPATPAEPAPATSSSNGMPFPSYRGTQNGVPGTYNWVIPSNGQYVFTPDNPSAAVPAPVFTTVSQPQYNGPSISAAPNSNVTAFQQVLLNEINADLQSGSATGAEASQRAMMVYGTYSNTDEDLWNAARQAGSMVAAGVAGGMSGAGVENLALEGEEAGGEGLTAEILRNTPGIVTASSPLSTASGNWLNAAVPTPIPSQVADELVGQQFNTFGDLRSAIWTTVADNDELNAAFSAANLGNIQAGNAPFAPRAFQTGASDAGRRFNLHHIEPIEVGGSVYDLSNLQITSPLVHQGLHQ